MKNKDIKILTLISIISLIIFTCFTFSLTNTYKSKDNIVDYNKLNPNVQNALNIKWEYKSLDGTTSYVTPRYNPLNDHAGTYKAVITNCPINSSLTLYFQNIYGDIVISINDVVYYANESTVNFIITFESLETNTIVITLNDGSNFKCGFDKAPRLENNEYLLLNHNNFLIISSFFIGAFIILFILLVLNITIIKYHRNHVLVLLIILSEIVYCALTMVVYSSTLLNNVFNTNFILITLLIMTPSLVLIRIVFENILKDNDKFKISLLSIIYLFIFITLPILYYILNFNQKIILSLLTYLFKLVIIISTIFFVSKNRKVRHTYTLDIIILSFFLISQVLSILSFTNSIHVYNHYYDTLIILLFSLAYLILNNSNAKYKEKQDLELVDLKEKIRDSEFTFLNSQIQSHFIYNTLNSIQALCYIAPERAANLIEEFSTYLRTRLDFNKMPELISFEDELKHIQTYLNIEKERFGNRIKYQFDLKVTNFFIPPLSIQPLVENSVKHGISKKVKGGTVVIKTYEDSKNIYIEVNDDGLGFDPSKLQDNQRVGTNNIRHRLGLHLNATFDVTSQIGKGTNYKITINKNNIKKA